MTTLNMTGAVPGQVLRVAANGDDVEPGGVVDGVAPVETATALAEVVHIACDATTGWTHSGLYSAPTTSTGQKTQGTASVKLIPRMEDDTADAYAYYTFSSALEIGDRSTFALDLMVQYDGPTGVYAYEDIEWVIADSTALTGNTQVIRAPNVGLDVWQTLFFPLDGLTEIKSVGFRRTGTQTGQTNARAPLLVDNGRFPTESKLDQALHDTANTGVIVGSYDTTGQGIPRVPTGTNFVDFRAGAFSNLNGTIWLDANYVDATGATDVSQRVAQVINNAPAGSVVKARHGGRYRFDANVELSGLHNVTIDFSGATGFVTHTHTDPFITFDGCTDMTFVVGSWFAKRLNSHTGTSFSTVAGSPSLGATVTLDALDEEVQRTIPAGQAAGSFFFARGVDEQVDGTEEASIEPRNHFSFTLADSAQVADDCLIGIYDGDTGELLHSRTLTLTGTPTEYWLSWAPDSLRRPLDLRVKKLTATTNTISLTAYKEQGRVEYSASVDSANFVAIERSHRIRVCHGHIEGFGADAIAASNADVSFLWVHDIVSRGCRRQGMSFNWGKDYLIENCEVSEAGRSGIDVEPYGDEWTTERVTVRNVRLYNIQNYIFAIQNWARNFDLRIENCIGIRSRFGFCTGGGIGARFDNIEYRKFGQGIEQTEGSSTTFQFRGSRMFVSNVHTDGIIELGGGEMTVGVETHETHACFITDVYFHGTSRGTPLLRSTSTVHPWTVGAVYFPAAEETTFTAVSGSAAGVADLDDTSFSSLHINEFNRQWPNTYKSPIVSSDLWVPSGYNLHDTPTFNARAISTGSSLRNNLRGRVTPSNGASSAAVTFPSRTHASMGSSPLASSSAAAGSLTPSTTYYYRVGVRDRFSGPATYASQISRTTSASETAAAITARGCVNVTNGRLVEGWTILRGTASGGPYTTRYDVYPSQQLFGHGDQVAMIDIGTELQVAYPSGSDTLFGYSPFTFAAQTGSWSASDDESGWEPDTSYDVWVSPSWSTTWSITGKAKSGFTINFGTNAPSGSESVAWLLVGF